MKNRIHASLIAFGHPCPTADLFGTAGRELLSELAFPEPWASDIAACLELIDHLDTQIAGIEAELRREGADHPYVPLLMSVPGISWILVLHHRRRDRRHRPFATPTKLAGYSGLCPRVWQSGDSDRRGRLTKNGPEHLRWALVEAAPKRPPGHGLFPHGPAS